MSKTQELAPLFSNADLEKLARGIKGLTKDRQFAVYERLVAVREHYEQRYCQPGEQGRWEPITTNELPPGYARLCRWQPGEPGQQVMPDDVRDTIKDALRESAEKRIARHDFYEWQRRHMAVLEWLQDSQPSEPLQGRQEGQR